MIGMTGENLIKEALNNSPLPIVKKTLSGGDIDGVKFTAPDKAKYIEYDEIKGKKKYRKTPENIGQWVASDFVTYASKLHRDRYGSSWELNFKASCQEILLVKDRLLDLTGFCDNIVLRDYLVYFFENRADDFLKRAKRFYFSQLRQDWVIEDFASHYDNKKYKDSVLKENRRDKT